MLLALLAAKGSPGVTTTALALAAASSGPSIVVELDPSGGDVEPWLGDTGDPGLAAMVRAARRDGDPEALRHCSVEAAPGLSVATAPVSAVAATAAIAAGGERLASALASLAGTVALDCGRWSAEQSLAARVQASSVTAIVCRPTLASVAHAGHVVGELRTVTRALAVVVVGEEPYPGADVAHALGVPLAGVLPADPRALRALLADGTTARAWARGRLRRAATETLATLETIALGVPAGA